MLDDKDRIFKNLYGQGDFGLEGARKRGSWDGTKAILEKGRDAIDSTRFLAGAVSQRRSRLEKNSPMRSGASRKSMAFRVGGVSTTMRS